MYIHDCYARLEYQMERMELVLKRPKILFFPCEIHEYETGRSARMDSKYRDCG
jgi:hypothetical protein